MPIFVKGYTTSTGKKVTSYSRNVNLKKGMSRTGRVHKMMNRLSEGIGYANSMGQVKRAKTLHKRMNTVRTYAWTYNL